MCKHIENGNYGLWQLSKTQVNLGYNWFEKGREDVKDNARLDRPSTSTTDENSEENDFGNHRITIREVADDVGILFGRCQAFFADFLDMERTYVHN